MGIFISIVVVLFFLPRCIEISRNRTKSYLEINESVHDSYGNLLNIYLNNESNNEWTKYDNELTNSLMS